MRTKYLTKVKGWYSFECGQLDIDMTYNKDIGKVRVIVNGDEIESVDIIEINKGYVDNKAIINTREIKVADFIEYLNRVWDEEDEWTPAMIIHKLGKIYAWEEDKWLEVFEVKDAD